MAIINSLALPSIEFWLLFYHQLFSTALPERQQQPY